MLVVVVRVDVTDEGALVGVVLGNVLHGVAVGKAVGAVGVWVGTAEGAMDVNVVNVHRLQVEGHF